MPRVVLQPGDETVECANGASLLEVVALSSRRLGSSCGQSGVCGRCRVRVVRGAQALSPPDALESRVAQAQGLTPSERLACRALVGGDLEVTHPSWGK